LSEPGARFSGLRAKPGGFRQAALGDGDMAKGKKGDKASEDKKTPKKEGGKKKKKK
jgi:hypothetical protein